MNDSPYPVKKNGVYLLEITSLAFGGKGVARVEDYVVFVKRAIPGDKVNARIIKRKKSYAEAVIDSFVEKSKSRIEAPCEYFDLCGGCTWQNMVYEDQLKIKSQIVADALKDVSGMAKTSLLPIIASENSFHYRNKMEFSFAETKWLAAADLNNPAISKKFALGLHAPGTFDRIIHIEHCMLQSEQANNILKYISEYAQKNNLQPYGIRSHQGFLRFLVIRQSFSTGRIMVNIVTAFKDEKLKLLAELLLNKFPFIAGVVNNINSRKAQVAIGEEEFLLAGESFIIDEIEPFKFNISANSFFQTNTQQAKVLYDKVIEFADLKENERAWDLYCGTGTITLFLAQHCKEVTGFEITPSSVENAISNAQRYQLDNTRFIIGDVIDNMENAAIQPDLIVSDPPRAGMHEKVVKSILRVKPKKMIYVSCNPTTMARDLNLLHQKYDIDKVQPVDMFPQTYHIECVSRLSLRANAYE